MHRLLIVLPAILAFPLAGCMVGGVDGPAYSETQRHSYANFNNVRVSAGVQAVVSQGAFDVKAEVLKGEGFDNLIVEVQGNTLRISRKPLMFGYDGPQYRVTVSAPAYQLLDASSGASVAGANLSLTDVEVDVSSGASIELTGTCKTLKAGVSSGGFFDGAQLRCDTAKVGASSGGTARAFATQLADGNASSGGDVTFSGSPAQLRQDTSSGGSVRAR